MKNTFPQLSPRLSAIAESVGECKCLADIGTDHAYIPVYLCKRHKAETAIACDINPEPLRRAESTVKTYNADKFVELRLGSGLDPIKSDESDAIVIAGMGGLLIANIIGSGLDKIKNANKIILQPMSAVSELREYLYSHGWRIISESLVVEENKIYNIISVAPPDLSDNGVLINCCNPSAADVFIGKYLTENRPENFELYLKKRKDKLNKMIYGLEKSKTAESRKKLDECRKLKEEISKI